MKKFGKLAVVLLALSVGFSAVACGGDNSSDLTDDYDVSKRTALDENEISYSLTDYDTYRNYIAIKDWNGNNWGTADPFVIRYNGEYYLYSTPGDNGIPCWKSKDMIHWQFESFVYGDGSAGSGGPETKVAYAPELIYYKGYFYLCESPLGAGHYIFRSKTPSGKFTLCSGDGTYEGGNLGLGIDGSFYIDQNDDLYLLSAKGGNGIAAGTKVTKLNFDENGFITADSKTTTLPQVYMGMWTEGASVLERNGYKYITHCGNHYLSAGYRIGYSYFTGEPYEEDEVYTPYETLIMLSTGDDKAYTGKGYNTNPDQTEVVDSFRGLGHNSNFYGPNLDSVYTAFHNAKYYDAAGKMGSGFGRAYNLGQYYTNGNTLMANGLSDFDTVMPKTATYTAAGLSEENGWKLSSQASKDVYTAEINLQLDGKNGSVVVGYKDSLNYTEIAVSETALTVNKYTGGQKTVLATKNLPVYDDYSGFHTVKVINGYSSSTVYYDGVKRVELDNALSSSGKIGVKSGLTEGSVQFTDDAYGTSDFESVKNLTGSFPAYAYLKDENRGYSIKNATVQADGLRQGEKESTKEVDGTFATVLKRNDWVKYAVNAPTAGEYALNVKVGEDSAGCIFEVIVDDEDIYKMKISDAVLTEDGYTTVNAGTFSIKSAGVHSLKIRVYKGTLDMTDIFTTEGIDIAGVNGDFDNTLSENFVQGKKIMGNQTFSIENGMTTAYGDEKSLYYFGKKTATNFEYSVDVKVEENVAGLVFRTKNFSYTPSDAASLSTSFQGYYLEIGQYLIKLHKYNYSDDIVTIIGNRTFADEQFHRVTIKAIQNKVEIFVDGQSVIQYTDEIPFIDGYCGLYSARSLASFKNLSYKAL